MDPTFKVDLEPLYSCSSSSYLKDHRQWGPQGLVAPLLMGRMSTAGPSPLTFFGHFLRSFFSPCSYRHFCYLFNSFSHFLSPSFPSEITTHLNPSLYYYSFLPAPLFLLPISQVFLFLHHHSSSVTSSKHHHSLTPHCRRKQLAPKAILICRQC